MTGTVLGERTKAGWAWAMRVAATGEVLLVLLQAATAGQLLEGVASARTLHGAGAIPVSVFAVAELVVAAVLWRQGRSPAWPVWASAALVVMTVVQAMLGGMGNRALHVPFGVGLVVLASVLAAWSWRSRPSTVERAAP
ncbi:hypothetical protein VA596_26695 [Amycolatopsis sp., V23-08]|uniref:Integral membrane protein n=1 Tax=Amycolatopsis heterodermiae TaxID=3110235 RepID=A0ABU5RA63_9PSEU|nr:hypothetical protein [Amycolatopsis sp., V23-08]MEA5363147.1 hypothetical protein [Amycolatopsis sp., V23-08]